MSMVGDKTEYIISAKDLSQAAVDSAKAGLKKFEDQSRTTTDRMKAHWDNFKKNWVAITAGIYAAIMVMRRGWDLMEQAADYQERINSLNALGAQYNMTGNQIVKSMKEASRGMLSMKEAADMGASALNLALSPAQMIGFTRVAESLTDVIGGTIPEAFNKMVVAAASGRLMTLAQMGIIVDLEAAYKKYADSINRSTDSLSAAEKQQIRLNVILEEAQRKVSALGPPIDTTKDKMDRLRATIEDLKLWMGQALIRAFAAAATGLQLMAAGALMAYASVQKLKQGIIEYMSDDAIGAFLKATVAGWKEMLFEGKSFEESRETWRKGLLKNTETTDKYNAAMGAANELIAKASANWDIATAKASDLATAMKPIKLPGMEAVDDSKRKAIESLNEQIRKQLAKSELTERQHIEWQANEWRKAGADKIQVAAWVAAEIEKIDQKTRDAGDKLIQLMNDQDLKRLEDWDAAEKKAREEAWKSKLERMKDLMEQEEKILEMANRNTIEGIKAMGAAVKAENEAFLRDTAYKLNAARAQYEGFWADMISMANKVGGELGMGMGMFAAGMKGVTDIGMGLDPYTLEMEAAYNHYYDMEEAYWGHKDRLNLITQAAAERDLAIEKATANQRIAMTQNMAGMMAGVMYSLYQATGQQSKLAFDLYKAFAISQAIISTYSMAVKSYDAMASIPYIGPALGAAAAAAAIAFGMAQVAAIASQRPGGGISAAGISGGGGYAYTEPTEPTWQKTEQVKAAPIVNLYIYGNVIDQDKFTRELIPSLKKMYEDGAH